ncbi:MAG: hypothetical protein ACLF0G_14990 [Candidatus Brocadiia bacterium]
MRLFAILSLAMLACLGGPRPAAGAEGRPVRRVQGFEPHEMKPLGKAGRLPPAATPPPGFRAQPPRPDAQAYAIYREASSRDWPRFTLAQAFATEGRYALRYQVGAWHERTSRSPAITAHPPIGGYHDVGDWLYQRHGLIWSEGSPTEPLDWSGYERLRFDVCAPDAPAVLGVRVRDATATEGRPPKHPHGLRTALAVFRIPRGKPVTCDVPLAALCRVGEVDLSRVHWMHIRLNGFEGQTPVAIDHLRLLPHGAAQEERLPIVTMEGEPRPFARKVWSRNPPPRKRDLARPEPGPVESLGPVTVLHAPGRYTCGYGHLGGHGGTYYQSARRGAVAWDNRRLLVVVGAEPRRETRRVTWGGAAEAGGMLALASFDGGRTWGGLRPGESRPVRLHDWYWRATLASDRRGDLYAVGTQNCDSYVEGHDIFFRRLAFDGTGWSVDRFAIVDQNGTKCPGPARALRLATARIWAAWTDGFGGVYAKHSDDDGLTWEPCKDAAAETIPRPFYDPDPADIGTASPPRAVLPWPAEPVPGPLLVPYRGQAAAFAYDASQWAAHDGQAWGPTRPVPWPAKRGGQASEAAPGEAHVVVARVEGEGRGRRLVALHLVEGSWSEPETLAEGRLGSSILTASGDAVFCFYVVARGESRWAVRARRWKDGAWGPPATVAEETEPVNVVGAPTVCPPSYAAVFWDQRMDDPREASWLRFARIANR